MTRHLWRLTYEAGEEQSYRDHIADATVLGFFFLSEEQLESAEDRRYYRGIDEFRATFQEGDRIWTKNDRQYFLYEVTGEDTLLTTEDFHVYGPKVRRLGTFEGNPPLRELLEGPGLKEVTDESWRNFSFDYEVSPQPAPKPLEARGNSMALKPRALMASQEPKTLPGFTEEPASPGSMGDLIIEMLPREEVREVYLPVQTGISKDRTMEALYEDWLEKAKNFQIFTMETAGRMGELMREELLRREREEESENGL
ncbi:MAG: hypothetical protein Q4E76_01235 [Tissierellia bacterium]|nr:hypothetical protein [Tissierellia bacterium]